MVRKIELTDDEIYLIIHGITGTVFPVGSMQKAAWELVEKLRARLNEPT